ncbi:hypothetical protein BN946_scf185043.g77 [Trametes cinnabarina]|uniref:F-box domain-containing protein n=1 Tax=Pycnoporus cinnabarinus TaxID=5643 RepID=A0A060SHN9_PYCCI|nr:hypothetical protein BN946_scf185043.g77 [Trametes cinnabarina]
MAFLASPGGQNIREYIRRLKLERGRASMQFLVDLLANLPSLRELDFAHVRFPKDDVDMAGLGRPRRAIDKLVFSIEYDQWDDSFVNILNILGLFTDIGQLEYWGGVKDERQEDVLPNLYWPEPVKIRSLVVFEVPHLWLSVILEAISKKSGSLDDGTLDTLTIGLEGQAYEVETLMPFVRAAAPCIRRLRLNPVLTGLDDSYGYDRPEELSALPLEECVNLRSLVLVIDEHEEGDGLQVITETQLEAYIQLLDRCAPNGIERVVFDLRCTYDYEVFLGMNWEGMDRVLSKIKSLQSVRVDYSHIRKFPVDKFKALVPMTVKRGILHIQPAKYPDTTGWLQTPFE